VARLAVWQRFCPSRRRGPDDPSTGPRVRVGASPPGIRHRGNSCLSHPGVCILARTSVADGSPNFESVVTRRGPVLSGKLITPRAHPSRPSTPVLRYEVIPIRPPTPTASMSSSPTVSIVFANLKGNVGDFAILDAMVRQLARRYPGRVIEVFSQGRLPVDNDRFRVFRERVGSPFVYKGPLANISVPSQTGLLGRVLRRLGGRARAQGRQVQWAAGELEAVVADSGLCGHDAVFFVGGALWMGGEIAVNMFGLLQVLVAQGMKVFTFPFSVHRSVLKMNRAADLRRYFSEFTGPILVRDGRSRATLKCAGVGSALMPDAVFSLPPLGRPTPPERTRPRVGFAVTVCRGPDQATFERVLTSLKAGGVDPVLVATCIPEDGDILGTLADSLDLPLLKPLGWEDAVRDLQALDLLVANRLHGLIFAFLGGTPTIPMVNREKVAGVAEDAGLRRRVEHLQQITPDAIRGWVREADEIVADMMRYRSATRATWDSFTLAPGFRSS
jgi:polysaccharide pyruvyl transferase WcaK-like protein